MIKVIIEPSADHEVSYKAAIREDISATVVLKKIFEYYTDKEAVIHSVEIETVNACNNDCSFCPVNRNNDTRIHSYMAEELFVSIIDQLVEQHFSGVISLFSNNEPLLDKRIFDFIDYAKKKLPQATHALYTNGILLNCDNFYRLVNSLDRLYIDNYDDSLKLNSNISEIIEKYKKTIISCHVRIMIRKKTQIRNTRAGQAPNRKAVGGFSSSCMLPFTQLVIRPTGDVSICCNDALGLTTIGNLNGYSITEIWKSKKYLEIRSELLENGRKTIFPCSRCDSFGINNYRPLFWDDMIADTIIEWLQIQNKQYVYISGTPLFYRQVSDFLKKNSIRHGLLKQRNIFYNPRESFIFEYNNLMVDIVEAQGYVVGKDFLVANYLGQCI